MIRHDSKTEMHTCPQIVTYPRHPHGNCAERGHAAGAWDHGTVSQRGICSPVQRKCVWRAFIQKGFLTMRSHSIHTGFMLLTDFYKNAWYGRSLNQDHHTGLQEEPRVLTEAQRPSPGRTKDVTAIVTELKVPPRPGKRLGFWLHLSFTRSLIIS